MKKKLKDKLGLCTASEAAGLQPTEIRAYDKERTQRILESIVHQNEKIVEVLCNPKIVVCSGKAGEVKRI